MTSAIVIHQLQIGLKDLHTPQNDSLLPDFRHIPGVQKPEVPIQTTLAYDCGFRVSTLSAGGHEHAPVINLFDTVLLNILP